MRRAVHSRFGSAHRFSQPLSGFLADPSFAALFRAATIPGILPSECFPRKDRAPLSRPPCSLAVIHPRALASHSRPYYHWFHRLPRFHAVAWILPAAIGFLSTNRSPHPGHPGSRATEPPRPASFTDFEASIPPRVRSCPTRVASTWRPILSWVSSPPESSPTAPWVLDPPRPPGPEHAPSSEDSRTRQEGSCNPPCRVSPSEHQKRTKDLVDGFQPLCEAGPDHLLGGPPPPLASVLRASSARMTYGVSEYAISGISSRRKRLLS
jgi:hypothetical protein